MGFLDLFRRKAITGTPGVLEALNARQLTTYPALGGTNLAARDRIGSAYVAVQNASYGWIYRYTPSIRRTVDYIARNVAQLGLKVYERVSDDEREHRGDHPGAEALRNPNPQTPGQHFIFQLVADKLIYDNAYALKFRADNGTLVLIGIPPHLVGLVGRSHFSVEAYRIWTLDGHSFDVAPEDIIHWRGYNPDDPRKGESLLETLREEIAADTASRQATTELHRSGLALPGWIERPLEAPDWGEEGAKRFMEQWANLAKQGKRRTPVLEEGMEFKQGGVTPEDAEMIAGRVWNQDLVSSLYGMKHVPPEGEEERKQFYADVLPPITEILAAFLDLHVLVNEYGADDHYFEFNMDEKLMGDDRLKALTSAAGAPPLTRNEARARLNLPAKEGGDELITPLNVTVGGKPSPMTMPVQDPNKPPQDGSHRTEDAPVPAGRSLNGNGYHRGGLIGTNGLAPLHDDYALAPATKAPLVPRRRRASERRDRWAGEYQGVLERHFDRQRQSLKSKRAQSKAITDDRWNTELGNGLNDVAGRQFEAEGKHVAFHLASTFDPDYGQNWLTAKSLGAAAAINLITQQHADEGGLDDAFDQAKGRVPGAAMAYATDIAAFSTKVAAEQAPGEPTVTIDGGECEVCAPFQGSWPMSEIEQWPAYHANCFPSSVLVSGPAPKGAVRRRYHGEVVILRFASGDLLTTTPNHPILTPHGFIPAGQLHEGSDVIRHLGKQGGYSGVNPDDQRSPSLIGDVWETLSGKGSVAAARMPSSAEDFHGDGMNGYVDVVGADRQLRHGFEPSLLQPFRQDDLGVRDSQAPLLASAGTKASFLEGMVSSPGRCVCGRRLVLSLLGAHRRRSKELSFAGVADADASLYQAAANHDSLQTQSFGNGEFGFPGDVSGNDFSVGRVESIVRTSFSGYVYNLQTEGGWYIANNTVVHNCNCVADVMSAAPEKALQGEVRAIPPQSTPTINMQPHFHLQVPEGAIKNTVNVDPPEVNIAQPSIHVAPAEVTIEEGAFQGGAVTVEAPAPADINIQQGDTHVAPAEVNFAKDAISVPVTVESPAPADVTIEEGAFKSELSIESPPTPDVNVTLSPQPKTTKKVIRDEKGHIKEIVEETKQTVKRDPKTNRIEGIEED